MTVPLGIAAVVLQNSLYDVPGGFRAVMFDRFTGVQKDVRFLLVRHDGLVYRD